MEKEYVTAFIGIAATTVGFLLNALLEHFRNRSKKKEEFYVAHYRLRQESYSDIYIALIDLEKYLLKFVNPGNEFYEMEGWENFAPLAEKDKLNDAYYKVEIWIDDEVRNEVEEIIGNLVLGCNLAIQICGGYDDGLFGQETVVSYCNQMIDSIKDLKSTIRRKCKMDKLDEYINKIS